MTVYDDPHDDTPELSQSDTPEVEVDTPDTPEVHDDTQDAAPEVTPEPAPQPEPSLTQTVAQLAASMQADYQRRQQDAERAQQAELLRQQELSRPRPLMEQEEWRQRYDTAQEEAPYSPEARQRLAAMNQELIREEARGLMQQEMHGLRLEMQADALVQQAAREATTSYGGLVRGDDFQTVALEVFGGNRAALAQALSPQNPGAGQVRQMIADAAAGRALREGRVQPNRPATPPANPRSPARPAPGRQQPVNEVTDPDMVIAALYDR